MSGLKITRKLQKCLRNITNVIGWKLWGLIFFLIQSKKLLIYDFMENIKITRDFGYFLCVDQMSSSLYLNCIFYFAWMLVEGQTDEYFHMNMTRKDSGKWEKNVASGKMIHPIKN